MPADALAPGAQLMAWAEAIVHRIADSGCRYAVFARRGRVSYCPADGVMAMQLRGNPESAACEVGEFGAEATVDEIAQALERAS